MFQLEVLVVELGTVDGLSTSAVAIGKVTTLDHEGFNDSVESGAFVAIALGSSSKHSEVLSGLGDGAAIETDHDPTEIFIAVLLRGSGRCQEERVWNDVQCQRRLCW